MRLATRRRSLPADGSHECQRMAGTRAVVLSVEQAALRRTAAQLIGIRAIDENRVPRRLQGQKSNGSTGWRIMHPRLRKKRILPADLKLSDDSASLLNSETGC